MATVLSSGLSWDARAVLTRKNWIWLLSPLWGLVAPYKLKHPTTKKEGPSSPGKIAEIPNISLVYSGREPESFRRAGIRINGYNEHRQEGGERRQGPFHRMRTDQAWGQCLKASSPILFHSLDPLTSGQMPPPKLRRSARSGPGSIPSLSLARSSTMWRSAKTVSLLPISPPEKHLFQGRGKTGLEQITQAGIPDKEGLGRDSEW